MDESWEEELTQPATQPLPPHNGVAPSESSGQDYSGVFCFLHPCSPAAIAVVRRAQQNNSNLVVRLPVPIDSIKGSDDDPEEMDALDPESTQVDEKGNNTAIDLALRYYPGPKDKSEGFVFGRNPFRCDVLMVDNANHRRISNQHFRIFVNLRGALMLEDMSTNGTWVDDKCLTNGGAHGRKRVLSPGTILFICPGSPEELIRFVVRIPKDSGKGFKNTADAPEDQPEPSIPLPQGSPGPAPNFGLPHIRDITAVAPGIVQTPGQQNVAAIQRLPNRPAREQHRFPVVRDVRDSHTIRQPSGSMAWGGDHRYSLSTQIGKGAFATVNKAFERQTGDVVAVKIIAKRTFAAQVGKDNLGVKKEVDILQRLDHTNIVKYVNCFEDSKHVYLVMEYIEFGDLNSYLNDNGTMSEGLTKQVSRQVLSGLEYIHQKGISHRDLKPDNILIASEEPELLVKISDFGLAKMVNNEETFLRTFCGTMLYLAPEVFPGFIGTLIADAQGLDGNHKRKRLPADDDGPAKNTKKHRRPYNQAVDIWSLGCVIYCLLCGAPPFEGKNQDEMCRLVTKGRFDEAKLRGNVGLDNDSCVDFLRRLLQVRPEMRMMETEALRHEWLYVYDAGSKGSLNSEELDEVLGIGDTFGSQHRSRLPMMDEDDDEDEDDEDDDEDEAVNSRGEKEISLGNGTESNETEGLSFVQPAAQPDNAIDDELRGSLACVSFGQEDGDVFDDQTSDNATGSDEFDGSMTGSGQNFSQGDMELSVIGRERRSMGDRDMLRGSSDVLPSIGLSGTESPQPLLDAFSYRPQQQQQQQQQARKHVNRQNVTGTESRFGRLAVENDAATPYTTPPSAPPKQSIASPFSFANNANFYFSPESLANPSPMQQLAPLAPPSTIPRALVRDLPEDDGLPPTQLVCSQVDFSAFRVPPRPWGRLIPMAGSIAPEPIVLTEQLVSIGRASNCTVKPDDIRISKFHFAVQIHYPDRDRQTDPRHSRVGEWRPAHNMVVSFQVLGRSGVYVNGARFADRASARLFDGDEVILFKDRQDGNKVEIFGYKAELTIGNVQRQGGSHADSSIAFGDGGAMHRDTLEHQSGASVSTAHTEVPGGQSGDTSMYMRV